MTGAGRGVPTVVARRRGSRVPQRTVTRPTVSVIIPCYNYGRYLSDAMASALEQRDVEIDVIVVDDASSDNSVHIALAAAERDSRIRVIVHPVNQGPVATFNDGLDAASGTYLIRLDADDLLTPGSVARSTALAETFPDVTMVYGHPVHFATAQPPRHRDRADGWTVWSGSSWLELRCRLGVNCITSPEVLMRASTVRKVGGQRELEHTHDMEMWFRLAREGLVGHIRGADQAWHREHSQSRSARNVGVMTDLAERAQAFETLFTDEFGDPADNARLWGLARSALANEAIARASQAYTRGRGATAEVAEYRAFARELGIPEASLPHGRILAHAVRRGPKRAPYSPYLVGQAVRYRAVREIRSLRWRATGL